MSTQALESVGPRHSAGAKEHDMSYIETATTALLAIAAQALAVAVVVSL
jgi:hypothetical protein